ncbi:MAG: RNA polymerase sigma factor [Gammaproteobacteria bacterium]
MGTATIHSINSAKSGDQSDRKTDRALIRRAVGGDRQAFQQIVEDNKRRMFSVANGVVDNPHLAEDVVQDALIKAYRALPEFRGDASLSTWLYRITYLTAIDHQRQQSRQLKLADAAEQATETQTCHFAGNSKATASAALETNELRQQITTALERLSPFEQTVFTLCHLQNFKLREIAVVVDRSEGTVKNILFRAIRKLRDQLADSEFALQEIERC